MEKGKDFKVNLSLYLFRIMKPFIFGILSGLVTLVILNYVFIINPVNSGSMNNTIKTNSLTISTLNYKSIERGDIVAFEFYGDKEESVKYVKRVIAIGGDTLYFENGQVYLNGTLLEEDYVLGTTEPKSFMDGELITVPKGELFLLGDNRENSDDSRNWEYPFRSEDRVFAKVKANFKFNLFDTDVFFKFVD